MVDRMVGKMVDQMEWQTVEQMAALLVGWLE